jgi:beta-lactamase class A
MNKPARYISVVVLLVAVYVAGFATARLAATPTLADSTASFTNKYPLLSQTLLGPNSNDILINFVSLRTQLNAEFNALPANTPQSFYFEYLPDGTNVRIGADNFLVAASLIKVPLVMNLFRAAELNKINLKQTVAVTQSEVDPGFGNLWQKGAGYKLTLLQAAQDALEQSDDTATHVIYDHINNLLPADQQSLASLDIDQDVTDGNAVITARAYASVLKALYYASFLTNQDSETILGFLTKSAENRRLTADLPKNVMVAHKNGVNNTTDTQSDCGIVYLPERPYFICVMVGLSEDQGNSFIASVSKTVYDYVSNYKLPPNGLGQASN